MSEQTGEPSNPFASKPLPTSVFTDNPYVDTHNLRFGPDLHPALLGLLPYVGVWRGSGKGGYPGIDDFDYAQEVRFSHDGRPFLAYESRSWLIDADGNPIRAAAREFGWWRPQPDDSIEVLINHPTGIAELYVGQITGLKVELSTDVVARTTTAKEVTGSHRLYGIVDGALLYAVDMAAEGHGLNPHLSAKLDRAEG